MTPVEEGGGLAIIVFDTSAPINFLRIGWTDLIAGHSHDFHATEHVAAEISDRCPDQRLRFAAAIETGAISKTQVTTLEELQPFVPLHQPTGAISFGCSLRPFDVICKRFLYPPAVVTNVSLERLFCTVSNLGAGVRRLQVLRRTPYARRVRVARGSP